MVPVGYTTVVRIEYRRQRHSEKELPKLTDNNKKYLKCKFIRTLIVCNSLQSRPTILLMENLGEKINSRPLKFVRPLSETIFEAMQSFWNITFTMVPINLILQ